MFYIFFVRTLNLDYLESIKQRYQESRVIFWDSNAINVAAIQNIIHLSNNIIAEDGIISQVQSYVQSPVVNLSEFDKELFSIYLNKKMDYTEIIRNGKAFSISKGPILFCPSNDSHVKMFSQIKDFISGYQFLLFDDRKSERTQRMLEDLNISYIKGYIDIIYSLKPSVLVFGNDWNALTQNLQMHANNLGIPTVCIQEGCLDFQSLQRMQWANYPIIQGPIMLKYLTQKIYFMAGNPKFDFIDQNLPLPDKPKVMINCNFTYYVHEDIRDQWVKQVAETCLELNIDFFISQHPRDNGKFLDYPVIQSSPDQIQTQLKQTSIIITRFSTLVYEGMAANRIIIYYNPHKETMELFNKDETGGIFKVYHKQGLKTALEKAVESIIKERNRSFHLFRDLHCGSLDGNIALRCASAIAFISEYSDSPYIPRISFFPDPRIKFQPEELEDLAQSMLEDRIQPLVSIIMPCFNSEKTIGESIQNLLDQSYSNWELIIIDDGSTDQSKEVIQSFKDKRIRYQYQENSGPSKARNTGLNLARGKYISFLDSDDLYQMDRIRLLVTYLEANPHMDLVASNFGRINEKGKLIFSSVGRTQQLFLPQVIVSCPFTSNSFIVKKDILDKTGGFDTNYNAGEDWQLYIRMALKGCRMIKLQDVLCYYRSRANSISHNCLLQSSSMIQVVQDTFDNPDIPEYAKSYEKEAKWAVYYNGFARSYVCGSFDYGKELFSKSLKYRDEDTDLWLLFEQKITTMMKHFVITHPDTLMKKILHHLPNEVNFTKKQHSLLMFKSRKLGIFINKIEEKPWQVLKYLFILGIYHPLRFTFTIFKVLISWSSIILNKILARLSHYSSRIRDKIIQVAKNKNLN